MAFSINRTPPPYSPAFNPQHWLVDSDESNKEGFEYFTQIHIDGQTYPSIDVPKKPLTGKGLLDVQSITRTFVDHEAGLKAAFLGGPFQVFPGFGKSYSLSWGVKYDVFTFDSIHNASGYLVLSSSTDRHDYVTNDRIVVQQIGGTISSYNGVHRVAGTVGDNAMVLDVAWAGGGPVQSGRTWHEDSRKISFSGVASAATSFAGYALDLSEFADHDPFVYVSTGQSGVDLLIKAPSSMRVRLDDQVFIPVPVVPSMAVMHVRTYDRQGVQVGSHYAYNPLNGDDHFYARCNAGPWQLINDPLITISGSTDIITDEVASYSVHFSDHHISETVISASQAFTIDRRCDLYQPFTILFCDQLGSFWPLMFAAIHDEKHIVKKETLFAGGFSRIEGNTVMYDYQRRGHSPYRTEVLRSFTVRSLPMTDQESEYFHQLTTSPRVFWQRSPDDLVPIVLDDQAPIKQIRMQTKDVIQYELSFTLAHSAPCIR
jgi:hypothetical protein